MQPAHRPLTTAIAGGIATMVLTLAGAPWWLTAAAFGCFALGLVVVAIQSLIPQESAHQLAWWRAYWHHRQLRRQTPGADHVPPTASEDQGDTGV
ncbi:hypothetical protein ACWEQL_39515 [Kitasatospora sp. NPDC004240]